MHVAHGSHMQNISHIKVPEKHCGFSSSASSASRLPGFMWSSSKDGSVRPPVSQSRPRTLPWHFVQMFMAPQRMNPFPSATVRLTFVVQSEISFELFYALSWHLLQLFSVSRGSVLMTLWRFLQCHQQVRVFTYIVKYLNIYWVDLHKMWYRYPWCPDDIIYWLWWAFDFSSSSGMLGWITAKHIWCTKHLESSILSNNTIK